MGNEENLNKKIYIQKKLKWYEKIWYFITRKKNKWIEINGVIDITIKEKNNE